MALTTRSREVPAALRMADTFSKHCLVCSWIVSPIIFPVTGSCGPVPETTQDRLPAPPDCMPVAETGRWVFE